MTPTITVQAPAVALKQRPASGVTACCSLCWDPVIHDGTIWRHVRTGLPASWDDKQCAPICDWPCCSAEADGLHALGNDEWTGSGFAWRNSHFLCDEHWAQYRRDHFMITRT